MRCPHDNGKLWPELTGYMVCELCWFCLSFSEYKTLMKEGNENA